MSRRRRTKREAERSELEREDPFLALIGAFSDPDSPGDVSVKHDHYLYGADPVLALEGFLGSEPDGATDVSVNHDHYLYGGPKKR